MRQTYYQAYQQILEAEQTKIKNVNKVKDNKLIKPSNKKGQVGKMNVATERVEHTYKNDVEKDDKMNEIIRASQNGIPVDKKARDFIRAKDLNSKYRGKVVSPFVSETGSKCTPDCGLFSDDENAVASAIDRGVPTNKSISSKHLDIGNYYRKSIPVDYSMPNPIDIGMVDALVYQCWNGNYINVKLILKSGYTAQSKYSGMNPITAAVEGKNIEILKLILSVPKIAEMVNEKDGFGNYPLDVVAKIHSIDPYEFAKVLIEAGSRDDNRSDKAYSAAMITLINNTWTPNLFGELLSVTDLEKKTKDGMTLRMLAEKSGNRDAVVMIDNYIKYQDESLNQNVLHSKLINRI